jgi:ATP-dependent phosphofructokinase / diphosphate-dependent phosphofructokinase
VAKGIGVLTAGGDSPGLNAAIRAIGKAAIRTHGMNVVGFRDGFRGMMQDRHVRLESEALSGILTIGGTILGTSRDKPHRMEVGGQVMDMTDAIIETFERHHLDALICLGGGGTLKNAKRLADRGMPVITLPKTIDNDVYGTDVSFGFDTALGIATEAVDRLHSTAHSHHRIIVVEIMGHNAGWLTLGAGLAGGADVVLIPEIPYDIESIADSVLTRKAGGSTFSIVAVAEGADSDRSRALEQELIDRLDAASEDERERLESKLSEHRRAAVESTVRLAQALETLTQLESRVTILGHVQRGGTPSPADRVLATQLGVAAADLVEEGIVGVMAAMLGDQVVPVPLDEVAGKRKIVTPDHAWVTTARSLGVSLGD